MSLLLITANLTSSMDSAVTRKSSNPARGKNTMMAGHSVEPGGKAGKKKVTKKNWTLAQTGGCGSLCGRS